MPKYRVVLYSQVYFTSIVEAEDEEEAGQKAWESNGPVLDLPEGVSVGESWELDYVDEEDSDPE